MTVIAGRVLPRTTPTALARVAADADRARAAAAAAATVHPDAIPSPGARYRPTLDGPWLHRIVDRVIADRRAARLDPALYRAMQDAILVALDRLYPPADMAVLQRHGFGQLCGMAEVAFGLGPGGARDDYMKPLAVPIAPRWLAQLPVFLAPVIRGAAVRPSQRAAHPLPADAWPWCDTLHALHRERGPAIAAAIRWPDRFRTRTGRWPRWGEIFDHFPIIGDWIADHTHPAHDAPDRGGDPGHVMPPRPLSGDRP